MISLASSVWFVNGLSHMIIYVHCWVLTGHKKQKNLRNWPWEAITSPPTFVISTDVMAEVQGASFQSAVMKWMMNCGIQHPVYDLVSCFHQGVPAARKSHNAGIDGSDRLTHWRYHGGECLRRLKWAMCQRSTSLQATDWGREAQLVSRDSLTKWLIGGIDPNQHFHCPGPEAATEEAILVVCFPRQTKKLLFISFNFSVLAFFLHIIHSNLMFQCLSPKKAWIPFFYSSCVVKRKKTNVTVWKIFKHETMCEALVFKDDWQHVKQSNFKLLGQGIQKEQELSG